MMQLTSEERRLQFVKLVQEMRTAQKEFIDAMDRVDERKFLTARENAEYCERQVDRALQMLQHTSGLTQRKGEDIGRRTIFVRDLQKRIKKMEEDHKDEN